MPYIQQIVVGRFPKLNVCSYDYLTKDRFFFVKHLTKDRWHWMYVNIELKSQLEL
ncbi:putative isomerase [Helianthus anomalus]